MINQLKLRYAAILFVSIFIYAIPFHIGGFGLKIFIAGIVLLLLTDFIRKIWKHDEKSMRNYVLMGVLNSVVLFQLVLIYSYLTFTSLITLIVGLVLSTLLYVFITNRMRQVI